MKMKLMTWTLGLVLAPIAVASKGSEDKAKGAAASVNTEKSFVKWTGYGVGKSHWGHVALSKAELKFDKQNPVSAEIVVDLNSIQSKDIENPEWAAKLDGHLKGEDFFDVKSYPKAKFIAKKIEKLSKDTFKVSGELNIKNKSKAVDLTMKLDEKSKNLVGTLSFDRTDFDVKYNSAKFFSIENLKDKAIEDKVDLEINLALNR